LGEQVFADWLGAKGYSATDYEWVSEKHARAAFDFHMKKAKWAGFPDDLLVEVKATKGILTSPIHMSMSEIKWAARHVNYIIARVYDLGTASPRLAMLSGIHKTAGAIMASVAKGIPKGVHIDGFEIDTSLLKIEFEDTLVAQGK